MITLVKATPLDFFEHTYLQVNIGELSADDIIVAETKRGIELYRVIDIFLYFIVGLRKRGQKFEFPGEAQMKRTNIWVKISKFP